MIVLSSKVLEIKSILKKTSAKMFRNLKVGDKIRLSIQVKAVGGHRGTYASYIEVKNIATNDCTYKTFNEIPSILACFEFEEVGD